MTDRIIRLPEVKERAGLSRSTLYRRMEEGRFPASIQLSSNAVGWYESEVAAWVKNPASWPHQP